MEKYHLFAYGTLRSDLYPTIKPQTGTGVVGSLVGQGFQMFDVNHFCPTIVPVGAFDAKPIVGRLICPAFPLSYFDEFENYLPDGRGTYQRALFPVMLTTSPEIVIEVMAWVYFMTLDQLFRQNLKRTSVVESGDWATVWNEYQLGVKKDDRF